MIWTKKDGTQIPIDEMSDSHLENTIRHLWLKPEVQLVIAYLTMKSELETRRDDKIHNEIMDEIMAGESWGSD